MDSCGHLSLQKFWSPLLRGHALIAISLRKFRVNGRQCIVDTMLIANKIVCNKSSCFAITNDGTLYCWGSSHFFEGFQFPDTSLLVPTRSSIDWKFTNLYCGNISWSTFMIGMTTNGQVLVLGANTCGQLGLGHTNNT